MNLTYRYRVKDKHSAMLNSMARTVNFVWNYCGDVQAHAVKWGHKWPTSYDLHRLTAGTSVDLGLSADTINATCTQYARSRHQHRKARLRFRGKRSLGWIPLKGRYVHFDGGQFRLGRTTSIDVWVSRQIPAHAIICDGSSIAQDARGRWYLNVVLRLPDAPAREPERHVGIDLGLKTLAALSTGEKIEAPRLFRASAARLASAQRARKKALARRIHDKIGNQRRDFLHKASACIVRDFDVIAVGNVNAAGLAKTKMAKSVLDAGWSSFRKMLAYKSIANGARYAEVDEQYSTQACSVCGSIGGPKGRKGLVIRDWVCQHCDAIHDRDVNAAKFILRRGLATLLEEPPQQLAA